MITSKLISRVPEIIAELPGKVDGALEDAANEIAEGARERVPVDTGALKESIHVEKREDGWAVVAGDGPTPGTGTSSSTALPPGARGVQPIPPHPFLIPAAEAEGAGTIVKVGTQWRTVI